MDISKLTISGFKSFYEKSVFTFDKNITAIVGPNGSGKSNITESIRFVLGEQSAKSMRGKDATDLLFRGNSAKASKAKVEIEFKKSKRSEIVQRGNIDNIFIKNALEKDEVIVSRTIYSDGKSEYMMNGVEVRVKDLQEFLLYVHLGNKSSWHISQGEADRVLQASATERKTIIEDALGLKVYHARINESLKKMDKTRENIREATIKRKELMPELTAMSRQVERIKRGVEFRTELEQKAATFLSYKNFKILDTKNSSHYKETLQEMEERLNNIEKGIALKEKDQYKQGSHDTHFLESELSKEEKVFNIIKSEHAQFENKQRSAINNLEYLKLEESKVSTELESIERELQEIASSGNDIIFSEKNISTTKDTIEQNTKLILELSDLQKIKSISQDSEIEFKKLLTQGSVVTKDNAKQISYLNSIRNRLNEKMLKAKNDIVFYNEEINKAGKDLEQASLKLNLSSERIESLKKQILEFKYLKAESEREVQKLIFDRSVILAQLRERQDFEVKIMEMEKDFQGDETEFKGILGNSFLEELKLEQVRMSEEEFNSLKRSIERLKIRLEESQVANPDEVMRSFEEMTLRDSFLLKEIEDLEMSMQSLEKLINDLKENLKNEFDMGLLHINKVFDSYVKKLFGGGGAKVFEVEIENKRKINEDISDEGETEIKTGIEVEVEIPKKKVKGLHSLSGGERALVSIALNFSIINQNPAPFMILDETDAALDEANSKRYGEILEMLKQETKLIVVTHNRETMHFADQVYGVTLAKEGYSKVLSVSFEDAVEYAK